MQKVLPIYQKHVYSRQNDEILLEEEEEEESENLIEQDPESQAHQKEVKTDHQLTFGRTIHKVKP